MTVSKVGQSTLPKWWRDASGLSGGGTVEVRPMRDGKNSIVLTPNPPNDGGPSGCLNSFPVARRPFPRRSGINATLNQQECNWWTLWPRGVSPSEAFSRVLTNPAFDAGL